MQLKDPNCGRLDRNFFLQNNYTDLKLYQGGREVVGRHKLAPGTYCIIPTTVKRDQEGDFLLRVFTEKPITCRCQLWDLIDVPVLPILTFYTPEIIRPYITVAVSRNLFLWVYHIGHESMKASWVSCVLVYLFRSTTGRQGATGCEYMLMQG